MQPFDLVGPSYTSQSPNLADMLTMNWYVESSEGEGQTPAALYPTPGTEVFANLQNSPIRGSITANDRTFVVAGSHFFEVFSDGTYHDYGTVTNDSLPVSMAAGSSQILIASAGNVYVFDFSTGHITATTLNTGGASGIFTSVLNSGGTGYVAGDTFTVAAGNMDATGIVDTVGGGGVVTAYHLTSVGQNYVVTTAVPTSQSGVQPGSGTGLTIDVSSLGGGYAVGDTGVVQGGTTPATYIITSIDASGNVVTYTISSGGAGYVVQNNVVTATGGTQPGIGAGFTINVTTVAVTNSFGPLPNGVMLGPISFVAYIEGIFVALLANSDQFQWSSPLDATTWDPLDTNKVSVFAGNVISMFADHNELWFWGERQSVAYALTGSANTFDVIQGSFMEAGIFAANSPVRLDNSLFWLGGDERGAGVVWRANGYTPNRVSNHAIEFALQGYLTKYGSIGLSNAVGYSYQDQGHGFYVLYFPTPSATWVYDVATGMWHQRGYWNSATASFSAHRSQNHTFNFGKHLVGDWQSGILYNMNISLFDDAGNQIRRVRRTRTTSSNQSYIFFKTLQIYLETGVGPTPPLLSSGTYTATRIQTSGGANAEKMEFIVGLSVNLRPYVFTVGVQNNGLTNMVVSVPVLGAAIVTIAPGQTVNVSINAIGATATNLIIVFSAASAGGSFDVIAYNPVMLDTVTNTNLIVASDRNFSSWFAVGGATLTKTQGIATPGSIPRDPMLNLRWSNDGGHIWSNELSVGIGQVGDYGARAMFRRLGRGRSRVWEVSGSDPVPYRLIASYLDPSAGEGA